MPARAHRDELITLIALVAVAACVVLGGVLSQSDDSAAPSKPAPSPAASSGEPAASDGPDDAGVLLGDQPFVYACRVLTTKDVQRIFGPSGGQGFVRQQYLVRSPTDDELAGASAFAYGGIETRCTHWFDDKAGHNLDVVVSQFPSTKLVERRWTDLTEARGRGKAKQPPQGRPVGGTDGRVIYLPASESFLIRTDLLTVEVRYTDKKSGTKPLDEDSQVPQVKEVLAALDLSVADGSAVVGPTPTNEAVGSTLGGTPYVDPCSLLDDTTFEALGGAAAEPVVVDTSVIRHDPYANTAVSSCERSGALRTGKPNQALSTFAVLEVRTTPDPATAKTVLDRHLANRYPKGTKIRPLLGYDGTAYVLDPKRTTKDPLHTRIVHVVLGPYELRFAAVRDVGPKSKAGEPPTEDQFIAAINAVAEALQVDEDAVP